MGKRQANRRVRNMGIEVSDECFDIVAVALHRFDDLQGKLEILVIGVFGGRFFRYFDTPRSQPPSAEM